MINCHTHIFTSKHVPVDFLPWYLKAIASVAMKPSMIKLLEKMHLKNPAYLLKKYYNFMKTGELGSQEIIFNHLQGFYPEGTQFTVLSMDMTYMGAGELPESFDVQLNQLAALKQKYGTLIHPFVFAHPERPDLLNFIKAQIERHKFTGIKLYPAIGYFPSDKRLWDIYKYAEDNQIPIMTHCTRGGVYYKGELTLERRTDPVTGEVFPKMKNSEFTDVYSDPDRYRPILDSFPNLKLCFAHYGGWGDWDKFLSESWHENIEKSWLYKINQFIRNEAYPNVFTDVSYTLVRTDLFTVLRTFMETNEKIRNHVLFGTDYYMTEIEGSERFFGMNLRGFLGESLWQQIAEENPRRYLGI